MILATAAFALTASQPSLAFVARFYKPGNAKSQFELYVSDVHGQNRKMLPTTEEPVTAQWIGKDRLAWFSARGLWTSKLSPWKPVQVKKTTSLHFESSRYRTTEPGMPEFVEDFDRAKGVFILNPTTLKLEPAMPMNRHQDIEISDEKLTQVPNPSSPEHPISLQKFESFKYWRGTREEICEWPPERAWTTEGGSKLWIQIGTHTSTSGDMNGLLLFEKGRDPQTLFDEANCVDFWTERSLYAFCTPRTTSTLGKKEVWTSELHVGDWKKRTDKTIIQGLVWVPSVSIRP